MTDHPAVSSQWPRTSPLGLQRLYADLAIAATAVVVVGLFAISPVTLEYFGLSYITSGGGVFTKFHPSTLVAVVAVTLRCLSTPHPLKTVWRLVTQDAGVVILLAATTVAACFAVVVSKTPVTPLVDTFVLPVLCFLLLRDLDATLCKWLALLVAGVLCANAIMAMIEFVRGAHFLTLQFPFNASSDPTRGDAVFDWRVDIAQDWRAVALLGHPLVNGLIVSGFVLCLVAQGCRWLPAWIKVPVLMLQCASMFTFGARTSLILTVVFSIFLLFQQGADALSRGARLSPRAVALALIVAAVLIGAAEILIESGFFDRTIERFSNDAGSAHTRSTMFELFNAFSWSDLFFGPDQDVVATWQRVYGLEFGIESSWIGLALTYGFVVTAIIVIGLLAFSRSVVRTSGRGTTTVLACYLISVSGSASMSGKVTSFAMTVIMTLLFLRRDERILPIRSALGLDAV